MRELLTGVILVSALTAAPREVSFPTADNGVVYANLYGSGERGVVLAHGLRFNKESWEKQANELAAAGFRVLAIDFRGYGKSGGGTQKDLYLDILAATRYLRQNGATSVAVLGGSMGGGAAANAVVNARPGEIDRVVLLAHVPIEQPERITGPKLFATGEGDPVTARVREQYEKAPDPKEILILKSEAHAQFLFTTDEGGRLMREIVRFLSAQTVAAH
jgi:pimeloyl-ACP methyl ester carboxylesterase